MTNDVVSVNNDERNAPRKRKRFLSSLTPTTERTDALVYNLRMGARAPRRKRARTTFQVMPHLTTCKAKPQYRPAVRLVYVGHD
jgi:hypothetical protein